MFYPKKLLIVNCVTILSKHQKSAYIIATVCQKYCDIWFSTPVVALIKWFRRDFKIKIYIMSRDIAKYYYINLF